MNCQSWKCNQAPDNSSMWPLRRMVPNGSCCAASSNSRMQLRAIGTAEDLAPLRTRTEKYVTLVDDTRYERPRMWSHYLWYSHSILMTYLDERVSTRCC
jgi:hypothetical protein